MAYYTDPKLVNRNIYFLRNKKLNFVRVSKIFFLNQVFENFNLEETCGILISYS